MPFYMKKKVLWCISQYSATIHSPDGVAPPSPFLPPTRPVTAPDTGTQSIGWLATYDPCGLPQKDELNQSDFLF